MTVEELREALVGLPDDMLVLVSGYEGGWDDAHGPAVMTVADWQGEGKKAEWWTGRYDEPEDCEDHPQIEAVVISR